MKRLKQKYYFIGKLTVEQLLELDDRQAKIFVCSDEAGKPLGFLIYLTPTVITLLRKMNII